MKPIGLKQPNGFSINNTYMKSLFSFFVLNVCFLLGLQAQTGTLRGTVIDDESGETIIGSTVVVDGTSTGTTTDLDGNYNLKLAPGTYTIAFSSISYATQKISDVVIKDGEVTIVDIRMKSSTEEIGEVVISASKIENTENALLTIQKKSVTVLDGISSQSISKTGDSDAAGALRRVPGVSVEGGKYVYVRGLGDRYTKTTLNGMEVPGLDPDRNTVQMDVFPTSLVDNIIVYKTFSPNLPGDFTGGVVDISTKSFPDNQLFEVSASYEYNTVTTFNPDFILYKGGKLDGLGFDDGTRKLPFDYNKVINKGEAILLNPELTEYTKAFSKELDAMRQNNFLNQTYSIIYGNQYNTSKGTFGLNVGVNYKNEYQFYEKAEFNQYLHSSDSTDFELDRQLFTESSGPLGQHNVIWSGLAAGSYKTQKSSFTLQLFHTQNGQSTASQRSVFDGDNDQDYVADILTYTQRSITNILLSGRHKLNKMELEWKNSFTTSSIEDPDLRTMLFAIFDNDTILTPGTSRSDRIFRDLSEINENFRVDFMLPFKQWAGLETKLRFGISETFKRRDFRTYRVLLNNDGEVIQGGADWLMLDQNIWTPTNTDGTYVTGQQEEPNTYNSTMNVLGAYVMNELPLHQKLNVVYGLRIEKSDIYYTGRKQQIFDPKTDEFNNERVLNELNFLPSVNIIYNLVENMNIRASYSRTLARPTFKEKSLAQVFDPVTGVTFIGNLDLQQTNIDNMDIRWEYFFGSGEMISVSGFYKHFDMPIEIVVYSDVTPRDITPRNMDKAKAFGLEFEFRKNFKFVHEKLEGLVWTLNLSYIKSQTELSPQEIEGRNKWRKVGEEIPETRPMFGQSPYIINTGLSYSNNELGLTATLAYNVQGKRLSIVGGGRAPDVYEQPFNSLNFKLTQRLGKKDQFGLSLTAANLLGDDNISLYETNYESDPQTFQRLVPGRSFKLGFSYRFTK